MQDCTKVFVENKILSNEKFKKKISGLTMASKRLSKLKLRKRSSSSRDSRIGLLSSDIKDFYQDSISNIIQVIPENDENFISKKSRINLQDECNIEQDLCNKPPHKNAFTRMSLSVKQFTGVGKERRCHSEAYHQD